MSLAAPDGIAARVLPGLDGDEVHVWLADLAGGATFDAADAVLSDDERERAGRFRFERDRREFTRSRALLRQLIAGYLGVEPRAVGFDAGPHGKPRLARPAGAALAFNLSHSGGLALAAVSRRGELGVDIEAHRTLDDRDAIARQFFSPREAARLAALPAGARTDAFFRCWSRKEAFVKAVGDGLSYPLDAFDVTFAPGEAARLEVPAAGPGSVPWTLTAIEAPPGYAAALVAAGPRRVRCWHWNDGRGGRG